LTISGGRRYSLKVLHRIAVMTMPVTLTFRHIPRTGGLESIARDIGGRLQRLNERMTGCHIVVEGSTDACGGSTDACGTDADASAERGRYVVRIHLSVPGAQIHAESAQRSGEGHREPRSALHAAYENAKRQLQKLRQLRARNAAP
jgi:hypothetical protein